MKVCLYEQKEVFKMNKRKIIEKISPDRHINIGRFNHYLRKTAHFLSYMVLGILVMNVLRMMRVSGGKK